ncbi:hypothetical protein A15D_01912 [Alcanivorax sp. MD8A]|nr:hypothetical protein A15D_01912 [Alcanivorax sp. MD8A]
MAWMWVGSFLTLKVMVWLSDFGCRPPSWMPYGVMVNTPFAMQTGVRIVGFAFLKKRPQKRESIKKSLWPNTLILLMNVLKLPGSLRILY